MVVLFAALITAGGLMTSYGKGWLVVGAGRLGKIRVVNKAQLDQITSLAEGINLVLVSAKPGNIADFKFYLPVTIEGKNAGYYAGCNQYQRSKGINKTTFFIDKVQLGSLSPEEADKKISLALAMCMVYGGQWDRVDQETYANQYSTKAADIAKKAILVRLSR